MPKNKKNSSSLYDDALPKKLKFEGVVKKQNQAPKVHTNTETPLSPYIIHLAAEQQPEIEETNGMKALAEQLILSSDEIQASELGEMGNLPECSEENLEIDFNDLVAQLREPEARLSLHVDLTISENFQKTADQFTPLAFDNQLLEKSEIARALLEPELTELQVVTETAVIEEIEVQVTTRKFQLPKFQFRISFPAFANTHHQALATFMVMSLAIILPLHALQGASGALDSKDDITATSLAALENLSRGSNAVQNNKYQAASSNFKRAANNFSAAEESLNSMNSIILSIASILPQTESTYNSVRSLLSAGKELSKAAARMTDAANEIQSSSSNNIVTKLNILKTFTQASLPEVRSANNSLKNVDPSVVPSEYAGKIIELQKTMPELEKSMSEFIEFSSTLATILGQNQKRRYLLIFQNNTELRATGGFIGSFAELDILNGKIESIHVPEGGAYDLQGQLSQFVAPPKPISLLNPRWEFHDANWFPDFPTSAKKIIWFYENSGGPTIDGVIAINATFMPELLELTGPIEMPEYDRTIDSENFLFETQKIVEFEYKNYQGITDRQVEAPKKFLGDLTPKILEKLEEADMKTLLTLVDLIGTGLYQKDIQMFFNENALQSKIEKLGWSGSLKQTSGDYLMVVNTNLGGGKTDTVIKQDIFLDTKVAQDGTIINTVTIIKEHKGLPSALFEGLNNVDYLRIYVPKGSELISASGFEQPGEDLFELSEIPLNFDEDLAMIATNQRKDTPSGTDIWNESGKTVFGNWIQTKPGEIETIKFKYKLPFTLKDLPEDRTLFEIAKETLGLKNLENYTLLIQKQSGVITRQTTATLSLPSYKKVIWSSHDKNGVTVNNNHDEFIRYLIEYGS